MAKKNNKSRSKNSVKDKEQMADEIDLTEGFGGIPSDVDFSRNIGCASNSKKKAK